MDSICAVFNRNFENTNKTSLISLLNRTSNIIERDCIKTSSITKEKCGDHDQKFLI